MLDWLRDLSHWITDFADSDWAALVVAINAFTESIFNPIPPDPLLIAIGIRQPEMALWMAALTTVASVLGAILGHWIGKRFGRPLLYRIVSTKKVDKVEDLFQRYGVWAILIAAFTPIPYKVFAITAGILDLNLKKFIIASIIGRGTRFFLIGGLLFAYGERIESFLEGNFEIVTIATGIAAVVVLAIAFIVIRRRRNSDGAEEREVGVSAPSRESTD